MAPLSKETSLASILASLLAYCLILYLLGCGGGDGDVSGTFADVKATVTTVGGMEFAHNGFYSESEFPDALRVADEYLEKALECAKAVYPEMEESIDFLPLGDLQVVVMFPDLYDPVSGQEAFTCKASSKGCYGEYKIGISRILVPPSLDALGHEISHWINEMLFGSTSHDDPDDLTNQCPISPICHLYSDIRNLRSCRE